MFDLILTFFSVIGITLLVIQFLDFLFYRKAKLPAKLFLDLREKSEEEIIEMLEMIGTVRSKKSGCATIREVIVIIDKRGSTPKSKLYRYMRAFGIIGTVYEEGENYLERFI